jgi:hypothetical protein
MLFFLAIADSSDRSEFNMEIVLAGMAVAAGVCILGAVPITIARRRKQGSIEGIAAVMVVWGLLTAASVIYTITAHMNYAREYDMRVMQNFDPRDQSDRPTIPWLWWTASAVGWGGTILWAATARSTTRRGFEITPPSSSNH